MSPTQTFSDTWTMTKRSLIHIVRSMDTIITVALMPIGMLLLFTYVFGGSVGKDTGGVAYVDFITPGIVIMTVVSGIAYAAFRLANDMQKGIVNRFRTMPISPSSVLGGQALSSTLSNLVSSGLVVIVAFVIGFRPDAGMFGWLLFLGLLVLFTVATTWLALVFGLAAKSLEGAGAFSYILMLLIFISPAFVPLESVTPTLRGFAEHQPMTPIVNTMRSLLIEGKGGNSVWQAVAWSVGILFVSYCAALRLYNRSSSRAGA